MSDFTAPPQQTVRGRVKLLDRRNGILFDGERVDIWEGEPIGDWVEFSGIRIALRRLRLGRFEGIVPDDTN